MTINHRAICDIYWKKNSSGNFQPPIKIAFLSKMSTRKSKKQKTQFTYSISQRNDSKFDDLRSNNLAAHIGKFIEIPLLGEEKEDFPKNFEPHFPHIFVTQELVDNLNEVVTKNGKDSGYVYSGPNGVGKSILAYLIACYAFVNGYPLIYIVCIMFYVSLSLNFSTF